MPSDRQAPSADAIETLERTSDFKLLKDSNIPAQEVLRIARTLILARVAQAKGDYRTNKDYQHFDVLS